MLRVYPVSPVISQASLVQKEEKEYQDPNSQAEQNQKKILLNGTSEFWLFPYIPMSEGMPGTSICNKITRDNMTNGNNLQIKIPRRSDEKL